MRRAFIFTIDALLSLLILLMIVAGATMISQDSSRVYSSYTLAQNKQIANNVLKILRTTPLSNLVSPQLISEWIENGTINTVYVSPQMPPLKIVATYWALSYKNASYRTKAEVILGYLLRKLTEGYKYQLIINNYTSPFLTFDNSYKRARNVGSATVFVSGYVANQSPRGYVAKAYITKVLTVQHKLVGIQRVLAGGEYCEYSRTFIDYTSYDMSLSGLYIRYTIPPNGLKTVSNGILSINGTYTNGSTRHNININENLAGWRVIRYSHWYGYVTLTNGIEKLGLKFKWVRDDLYKVYYLNYTYPNGDIIEIEISRGIYFEYNGTTSDPYASYVYTSLPVYYYSAIYNVPVIYSRCYSYTDNNISLGFSITLPSRITPLNGLLSVYPRNMQNVFDVIKFNNITWTSESGELQIPPSSIRSENSVYLEVSRYRDADEVGTGSGSWISLTYKTPILSVSNPGLVKLYNITSEGTGIYYLNSLFVPGNVTGINIKLTVSGVHVVRIYYSNGTGMVLIYKKQLSSTNLQTVYIDNRTLVTNLTKYVPLSELSRRNFKLIIMLDAYYNPNYYRVIRYAGQDYNYNWNNVRELYGYPYSYINITYTPRVQTNKFTVPIEQMYNLSPSTTSYYMTFSYYLPEKAIPWYVDIWSGVVYTPGSANSQNYIYVYEGPNANTEFLTFHLDFYMIRLAYTRITPNIMVPGEWNEFYIKSGDSYYQFRPQVSKAIVHYFLNGYAPYGTVFPYYSQQNACGYNLTYWYSTGQKITNGTVIIGNCPINIKPLHLTASQLDPTKYALDNAIYRLFLQLGAKNETTYLPGTENNPISVNLQGLEIKAVGVRNVPTTIAPIQVTLRIWRGG